MNDVLHILINDESEEVGKQYPVYKFFDVLKRPFIQLKDINQLDYLIQHLSGSQQVAIWVHPNANQRKETRSTTPGEASATALTLDDVAFDLVSRYPEDVDPKLIAEWKKTPIDLNQLGNAIKNVQPVLVSELRKDMENLAAPANIDTAENITIAIITGLYDDEFTNLQSFFEDFKKVPGFKTARTAKLKDSAKRVIIDFQSKMGMVEAATLSTQLIDRFPITDLIMVGVCGGRRDKGVNLLDILIPEKVFDYQTGKLETGVFKPYLRVEDIEIKAIKEYFEDVKFKVMKGCLGTLKDRCKTLEVRHGSLACGSIIVSTDEHLKKEIAKYDEEVRGVEMESYGVALAAKLAIEKDVRALIIKSVMDYTDSLKGDGVKGDASYLSASFAYYLIKDYL